MKQAGTDADRPVRTLWRRLALVFCLLVAIQDAHYAWLASGLRIGGATGATIDRTQCAADRFCPVSAVVPGSPAAEAGIAAGDHVRYDQWWRMYRALNVGESVEMTVRRAASERHVSVGTQPRVFFSELYILTAVFLAVLALTAALIVARAGTRRSTLLLALAMACFAVPGPYPRGWQNAPGLFEFFFVTLTFLLAAGPLLLAAAMFMYRQRVMGSAPSWIKRAFWPATAVVLGGTALGLFVAMNASPLLGISDGLATTSIMFALGALFAASVLLTGWEHVPAADRTRYTFMASAAVALCVNAWVDPVIMLTTNNYAEGTLPVLVQIGAIGLAAFLFAYAILRHRAVDLGFAVNRTLVYSSLSAIMVAAFVLAEEGAERLLPANAHDAGLVVQAGIALLIFGVFDRLRSRVEGTVERMFFARWREYEERLRSFIGRSPFFSRPATLIEQVVAEIQRFTDGAEVALYRRSDGAYQRLGGSVAGVPRRVDLDRPALVAMRADRALQRGGIGETALLLPMVQRGEVFGFLAVGHKPDRAPFRPDEEMLLADTAQAVGLDLHALRVSELERENRRLAAAAQLSGPG
jgi:hypothetical protein